MRKGEIPLFAAAVEILGRHALVADEPAALVVAEPYAGLVVDEHEVPCQIGKARMGCPLGDPHLLATLLVLGVGRKLVAEIRGEGWSTTWTRDHATRLVRSCIRRMNATLSGLGGGRRPSAANARCRSMSSPTS